MDNQVFIIVVIIIIIIIISRVEVYKRVGKSVFPSVERSKRTNRRIYGYEKVEKFSFFLFNLLLKAVHL